MYVYASTDLLNDGQNVFFYFFSQKVKVSIEISLVSNVLNFFRLYHVP